MTTPPRTPTTAAGREHQPVPTSTDTTLAWVMKSYGWRVELFWNSGGVWFTARLVDGDGNLMPRGDPIGVSAQSPGQALADLHDAVLEWACAKEPQP